jgi:hypothetical protein
MTLGRACDMIYRSRPDDGQQRPYSETGSDNDWKCSDISRQKFSVFMNKVRHSNSTNPKEGTDACTYWPSQGTETIKSNPFNLQKDFSFMLLAVIYTDHLTNIIAHSYRSIHVLKISIHYFRVHFCSFFQVQLFATHLTYFITVSLQF